MLLFVPLSFYWKGHSLLSQTTTSEVFSPGAEGYNQCDSNGKFKTDWCLLALTATQVSKVFKKPHKSNVLNFFQLVTNLVKIQLSE